MSTTQRYVKRESAVTCEPQSIKKTTTGAYGYIAAQLWIALLQISAEKGSRRFKIRRKALMNLVPCDRLASITQGLNRLHNANWIQVREVIRYRKSGEGKRSPKSYLVVKLVRVASGRKPKTRLAPVAQATPVNTPPASEVVVAAPASVSNPYQLPSPTEAQCKLFEALLQSLPVVTATHVRTYCVGMDTTASDSLFIYMDGPSVKSEEEEYLYTALLNKGISVWPRRAMLGIPVTAVFTQLDVSLKEDTIEQPRIIGSIQSPRLLDSLLAPPQAVPDTAGAFKFVCKAV